LITINNQYWDKKCRGATDPEAKQRALDAQIPLPEYALHESSSESESDTDTDDERFGAEEEKGVEGFGDESSDGMSDLELEDDVATSMDDSDGASIATSIATSFMEDDDDDNNGNENGDDEAAGGAQGEEEAKGDDMASGIASGGEEEEAGVAAAVAGAGAGAGVDGDTVDDSDVAGNPPPG